MAGFTSTIVTPCDAGNPMGFPGVRGGRVLVDHVGKVSGMRMLSDEKNGCSGSSSKTTSMQFRCSANSHSFRPYQNQDPVLNLQHEVSVLRGEGNNTVDNPRKENFGGVTESQRDQTSVGSYNEAKIKVIGVGGGGSNAVNHMIESAMTGVELWIVNTDVQAMKMSPIYPDKHLQISQELTRGLGAGKNLR